MKQIIKYTAFLAAIIFAQSALAGIELISKEQLGEDWPFTAEEMHLSCLAGGAVVVMDVDTAEMYPVNGMANSQAKRNAMKPLAEIWLDNPEIEGAKISVNRIIERGLELCK